MDLIKLNGAVCLMELYVGCGLTAGRRCLIIPEKTRSRRRISQSSRGEPQVEEEKGLQTITAL